MSDFDLTLEQTAHILESRFGLDFPGDRLRILKKAVSRHGVSRGSLLRNEVLSSILDECTNNLTKFFRNRSQLAAIEEVLQPSQSGGSEAEVMRVWVAGCSTGEEAFSLAMILREGWHDSFAITATDISRRALATAARGRYTKNQVSNIPVQLRSKYIIESGTAAQVIQEIRSCVEFRQHSVTEPPPPGAFGLITCRNVLTYLSERARRIAVRRFRDGLVQGGYLAIGNAESLPGSSGFAAVRVPGGRLFRRR